MKWAIITLMVLLVFPTLVLAITPNVDVIPNPSSFDISVNLTEEVTIEFNLTNDCEFIIENLYLESEYLESYSPGGKTLSPTESVIFSATLQIIDNITNMTEGQIINDTLKVYGDVVYEDPINITKEVVASIPLKFNISIGEPTKLYFYKKCFIEEEEEFCTTFNISDVTPVVVINKTEEYYNVLLPLNLTKDFFDSYNESISKMVDSFEESKADIQNASQQIIEAQERESNIFRNAFVLENYLKNPNNPTWVQIAPMNLLKNTTGFTDDELTDALNILFQTNKISQKTEKEQISIPVPSGVMTQSIDKVYIGSTERLKMEATEKSSADIVTLSIFIVVIALAFIIFYELLYKKRVSF